LAIGAERKRATVALTAGKVRLIRLATRVYGKVGKMEAPTKKKRKDKGKRGKKKKERGRRGGRGGEKGGRKGARGEKGDGTGEDSVR